MNAYDIEARPLTKQRWDDLVTVFGPQGACCGCWCMYWRTTRREFAENGNAGNRVAFKRIVDSGVTPGILYYVERKPVGWCSIGPRSHYPALDRSPLLRPVDERQVWAIVCFYLLRAYRHQGLYAALVRRAVEYARSRGAEAVEAYPDLRGENGADAYMGIDKVYRELGFEEVARRRPYRPILRYEIV